MAGVWRIVFSPHIRHIHRIWFQWYTTFGMGLQWDIFVEYSRLPTMNGDSQPTHSLLSWGISRSTSWRWWSPWPSFDVGGRGQWQAADEDLLVLGSSPGTQEIVQGVPEVFTLVNSQFFERLVENHRILKFGPEKKNEFEEGHEWKSVKLPEGKDSTNIPGTVGFNQQKYETFGISMVFFSQRLILLAQNKKIVQSPTPAFIRLNSYFSGTLDLSWLAIFWWGYPAHFLPQVSSVFSPGVFPSSHAMPAMGIQTSWLGQFRWKIGAPPVMWTLVYNPNN